MSKLDSELQKCLFQLSGDIRFIKNKFLTTIYMESDMDELLYNKPYRQRRALAEKALCDKDFQKYVYLHERPFRLQALVEVLYNIKKEELFDLVEWVWIDSEDPCVNLEVWKLIFQYCDSLGVLDASKNGLPNEITIYRGTRKGIKDKGISWTLDRNVAKKFSERFFTKKTTNEPLVKEKVVKKSDIWFYTDGRGEKEIVLK